jgi:cellulose synthase (UDP-forming)
MCEDIHTTYLLLRQVVSRGGWGERTVERFAESIVDYINQRSRWCLGTVQLALLPNGLAVGYSPTARLHFPAWAAALVSKPF